MPVPYGYTNGVATYKTSDAMPEKLRKYTFIGSEILSEWKASELQVYFHILQAPILETA